MNIFNWAQDNNVIWIENIRYWMLNNLNRNLYNFLSGSNGLTEKRALKICKNMFNHIGLNGMDNLARLIGFGEDDWDYYYITKDQHGKIVWESMVGDFNSLKGKISNWSYDNLERTFQRCDNFPEKEFIHKKEKNIFENE